MQQPPHLAARGPSAPQHQHTAPTAHMQPSGMGGVGGVGPAHGSASPSKVLHIRGLPPYTSENDVLSFFASLPAHAGGSGGGVSLTRILLLPNSNQAFLQLASVEQAVNLVAMQAQQGGHFVLKGNKSIIVQFSNRQEIHTPATIAAAAGGGGGAGGVGPAGSSAAHAEYKGGAGGVGNDSQQTANSILIVTVLNTRVPVTLDHIHQIFKPYGDVLKIITFHKNGVFKALVQLSSVEAAINARSMLEGKDIFQGCCHLRIGFSSLHELHVKAPGTNARDFTSPSGASQPFGTEGGGGYNQQQSGLINNGGGGGGHSGGGGGAYGHNGSNGGYDSYGSQHPSSQSSHGQPGPPSAPAHPHSPGCVVLVSNLPDVRVSCDVLFTLFGVYGDVQRVKILYNKRDTALIQFMSPQSAYLAALHLNQLVLYGKQISVTPSKHIEVSLPKSVHNGGTQAEQEQHASGLTQDYTHSPIHRFRRSAGAAGTSAAGGGLGIHAKSIHPPRPVLHVSSLADAVTEDELRQLFSTPSASSAAAAAAAASSAAAAGAGEHEEKTQHNPPVVQFFTSTPRPLGASNMPPKASKQAFLRFDSVSAAVEALIDFHNYNLHGRYLRISFSGKEPAQVHETLNGQPIHPPPQQQQNNNANTQQQQQQQQQASPAQQQQQSSPQHGSTNAALSPNGAQGSPSTGAEGQAATQD